MREGGKERERGGVREEEKINKCAGIETRLNFCST